MNTKLAIAVVGISLLVLVLVAIHRSRHAPDPTAEPLGSSRPAATPVSVDGEALLPFTPRQISQAAALATTFAAAYASHRYDEPPTAYLNRLAPMIDPQLRPIIERAATDPATLNQRRRLQQITTAQAHPDGIRTLGPTSITFLVTVTEHVATAHANRTDTSPYALTLTPTGNGADRDGWRVYAIELASTGNAGELTTTPGPTS
jgi:hypothetical protein